MVRRLESHAFDHHFQTSSNTLRSVYTDDKSCIDNTNYERWIGLYSLTLNIEVIGSPCGTRTSPDMGMHIIIGGRQMRPGCKEYRKATDLRTESMPSMDSVLRSVEEEEPD